MARTIRFHLDEHVHPAIAAGLRLERVDVTTTRDAGLLRAPDTAHVAYALQSGRVIFTQDDDFLRLHAAGVEHRGIVYSAQQTRTIGQIIAGLVLIWEVYEPEEMVSRVEFM